MTKYIQTYAMKHTGIGDVVSLQGATGVTVSLDKESAAYTGQVVYHRGLSVTQRTEIGWIKLTNPDTSDVVDMVVPDNATALAVRCTAISGEVQPRIGARMTVTIQQLLGLHQRRFHASGRQDDFASGAPLGPAYSETVLEDGPTGYWPFDETSGIVAFDASGFGNDLAITSGAAGAPSVVNSPGQSFDGSAGAGVAFGVSPSPLGVIPDNSEACTIECWVQIDALIVDPPFKYIVSYPESSIGGTNGVDIRALTSSVVFDVVTASGGLKTVVHTGAIPINTPTHLVVTYDGAFVRGYYNGVEETPTAQTGGLSVANEEVNVARVGASASGASEHFGHLIDEVAFYDKALSAARILDHYLAGL